MNLRSVRAVFAFGLIITATSFLGAGEHETSVRSLYDAHHWFALRNLVMRGKISGFYRGAVECAFNRPKAAKEDLAAVIRNAPHSADAYEAHSLLAGLYLRSGQFRGALAEVDAMLAERPGAEDAKNVKPLFSALSQFPDQRVVQKQISTVAMHIKDGNLFVPLKINGTGASYIVDTGFSTSAVSESEAVRLGLAIHDTRTKTDSMTGAPVSVRVAVADNLNIGYTQLANVAFLVYPDQQPPFDELPAGERGILGIPVILALETIRWTSDATFTTGWPTRAGEMEHANLCFESAFPVVQIGFRHSVLDFTVDTGAQNTDLYQAFASTFSDLVKSGKRESHKLTGVGGSANVDSVILPLVTLRIGGHDVLLRPAHVLLQKTSGTSGMFEGNLGMDLLNQAHAITLNFQSMTLTLE
jgi:predicted aspartyl protease